ncbi:MAG: carbohydrate porin [Lacunisphaera sp.]
MIPSQLGKAIWLQALSKAEVARVVICDRMLKSFFPTSLVLCLPVLGFSQTGLSDAVLDAGQPAEEWSLHFQATTISEKHGSFSAPYSGTNSLQTNEPWQTTETGTIFAGRELWSGGEIYLNPEISGGKGLSGTVGAAGFPNGEATRVGATTLTPYLARLFFRQTFNLDATTESVEPDANQLGGSRAKSNITLTLGRFAAGDVFDDNSYSHDPRTQFSNWSLMANGAWDFPADTRGYTYGVAVELNQPDWALRVGALAEPTEANGARFDHQLSHALGTVVEWERSYSIAAQKGVVRFLTYLNSARMGSYRQTIDHPEYGMDITRTRRYRTKQGLGLNFEQAITQDLGLFGRAGWNDGHTETWAFTEIDNTLSLGLSLKGTNWQRKSDTVGLAGVSNGLSSDHRDYLAAGGYGFIVGDGRLDYRREEVLEGYYAAQICRGLTLSVDFQYLMNPAYNRDRGPVVVSGLRLHAQY